MQAITNSIQLQNHKQHNWKTGTYALYFADDGLIMGTSEIELMQKLNLVRHEMRKVGLKINNNKSEKARKR